MTFRLARIGFAILLLSQPVSVGTEPRLGAPSENVRTASEARVPHAHAGLKLASLGFEPNHGQFDPAVRFASRARGYTLFLTDTQAVLALGASSVRLTLDQARLSHPVGLARQSGVVNYLIGKDPAGWHTGIPVYERVAFDGVYPGIDLVYYGRDGKHEYDFAVAPGADATRIAMRVSGAERLNLDEAGNLLLATAAGPVTMRAPFVYQEVDGVRQTVAARYALGEAGEVRFELGAYDRSLPLTIDPELVYGTFLGGTGNGIDVANDVSVDETGAAYIVGTSETTDFPTRDAIQEQRRGLADAVVSKITKDGQLVYSTYLGGSSYDYGTAIDVRVGGVAYIVGDTSSADFPTPNAFQREYRGGSDSFVLELSADGRSIVKASFLGGSGTEGAAGVQLSKFRDDPAPVDGMSQLPNALGDRVFVFGSTTSPDFPTLAAPQANRAGERDGFVTVLDRLTLAPVYSTYVGQDGVDEADSLVLNRVKGDFYMLLQRSDDVGPLLARFQARPSAATDRLRAQNVLDWGLVETAFLAGFAERDRAAAEQQSKSARMGQCGVESAAFMRSDLFQQNLTRGCGLLPTSPPRQQRDRHLAALANAVLERTVAIVMMPGCLPVAPATTCTERATVILYDEDLQRIGHLNFGGTRVGREFIPTRVVSDKEGRWHFIGRTSDTTLPVLNPVQGNNRGSAEGFVLTLDPSSGETTFLSYLGGSSFDTLMSIAVDGDGHRWIVGSTQSGNFPVTRSGVQGEMRGRIDGFVVKITP